MNKMLTLGEFVKEMQDLDKLFDTSQVEPSLWCEGYYPTTIIMDRYDGTYSGGKWVAFPCLYDKVPDEVEGEDMVCSYFWENYDKIVGKGDTPEEAFGNLKMLMTNNNM